MIRNETSLIAGLTSADPMRMFPAAFARKTATSARRAWRSRAAANCSSILKKGSLVVSLSPSHMFQ
jgi:hypothetical protein